MERTLTIAVTLRDDMDEEDVREAFRVAHGEWHRLRERESARARANARRIVGTVTLSEAMAAGTLSPRDLFKRGLLRPLTGEEG